MNESVRLMLERTVPELRRSAARIPHLPLHNGLVRRFVRWASARSPQRDFPGIRIEQRADVGRGVRIYHPQNVRSSAALFWIHGGGYVIGSPLQNDGLCASTARELGIVVVSAGYRLAPEHPFPAPLDDCLAAWQWLQREAAGMGIDPARIAIGGESAGGGLAAGLVQRLHDGAGPEAAAQWLLCPMIDDRTVTRHELDGMGHLVWNNRSNAFGWRAYLGKSHGSAEPPAYAVPSRRSDLSGLPPAWIEVGDLDLFRDEDEAYSERLRAAGVDVTFTELVGAPHGFQGWAPDAEFSRKALAEAQAWLKGVLAGA